MALGTQRRFLNGVGPRVNRCLINGCDKSQDILKLDKWRGVLPPKDNPEIFEILDRAAKEKGFDFMQAREALKFSHT